MAKVYFCRISKSDENMISNIFRIFTLSVLLVMIVSWCKPCPVDYGSYPIPPEQPEFTTMATPWADSVFLSMNLKERIAQMFMIQVYSNKNEIYYKKVDRLVHNKHVGGIIFFQGGPVRQVNLVNRFQNLAKTPLMIGMDAEWGPNMRMPDSTMTFPKQMQLGAIENDSLIFELGKLFAEQCKILGATVNFAPVVDVNNNPANPVINTRSFGELPENVARKGLAYAKGMESVGVLAVAKHFPGHGDTSWDSHKTLPTIPHNRARLDSVELYPFKYLIENGVGGIMNAHLHVPHLDATKNLASSISPKVVKQLLKKEMGFRGLAFTDALGMKGVSAYHSFEEKILKAFRAGNDVLLMPKDLPKAIDVLAAAAEKGTISKSDVYRRCRKILKAKEWMGLDNWKRVRKDSVFHRLNSKRAKVLRRKLIEASIAVVHNREKTLPIVNLEKKRIASLVIGNGKTNTFQKQLKRYSSMDQFQISKYAEEAQFNRLVSKLSQYDIVIVGIHKTFRNRYKNYGITSRSVNFVHKLAKKTKVVLSVFANPYALRNFKSKNIAAVVLAHRNGQTEQDVAAQVIFGGIRCEGQLPVSAGDFKAGAKSSVPKIRLSYVPTEFFELEKPERIASIDRIIEKAIERRSFPGCQLLVAYDGVVFLDKTYGYHTYKNQKHVGREDLYDLASITKISTTLPLVMRSVEDRKIELDKPLALYYPKVKGTNKSGLRIRDILLHQSGLKSWIPFYHETFDVGLKRLNPQFYASTAKHLYKTPVAKGLYILDSYKDTILQRIFDSELLSPVYRYSDLGFIMLKEGLEYLYKKPFDKQVDDFLFKPLGTSFTFNAWEKSNAYTIVPSEQDVRIRKQTLKGYVHDMAAAQLGGVAGHAGLFGNANDVAVLMQMYMNNGWYGGKRYLRDTTIAEFTRCHNCYSNRRGLGFDKPMQDGSGGPTSVFASLNSYGHSGFTGGLTWADPEHKLLFVFLTNRTYPSPGNDKIINESTRTRVLSLLYQAVGAKSTL